ncbi:MAG: hypothetical protein PVH88_13890 [Ignavibacteria bacterium]|jgi:hypothetical protein
MKGNKISFSFFCLFAVIGCDNSGLTDNVVNRFQSSSGVEFSKDGKRIAYSKTIQEIQSCGETEIISEIFISFHGEKIEILKYYA